MSKKTKEVKKVETKEVVVKKSTKEEKVFDQNIVENLRKLCSNINKDNYEETLANIQHICSRALVSSGGDIDQVLDMFPEFEVRKNKSGITFLKNGKRLFKIITRKDGFKIELNVRINDKRQKVVDEDTAREKHMGSMTGFCVVESIDEVKEIINKVVASLKG